MEKLELVNCTVPLDTPIIIHRYLEGRFGYSLVHASPLVAKSQTGKPVEVKKHCFSIDLDAPVDEEAIKKTLEYFASKGISIKRSPSPDVGEIINLLAKWQDFASDITASCAAGDDALSELRMNTQQALLNFKRGGEK